MQGGDAVQELVPNQCLFLCTFFGLGLKFPSLENNWLHLGSLVALPPFKALQYEGELGGTQGQPLWDHLH